MGKQASTPHTIQHLPLATEAKTLEHHQGRVNTSTTCTFHIQEAVSVEDEVATIGCLKNSHLPERTEKRLVQDALSGGLLE